MVSLSRSLAGALEAGVGDLVYITDRRWWTGGLSSVHATVGLWARQEWGLLLDVPLVPA